jgi:hypothetical protein
LCDNPSDSAHFRVAVNNFKSEYKRVYSLLDWRMMRWDAIRSDCVSAAFAQIVLQGCRSHRPFIFKGGKRPKEKTIEFYTANVK